MFISDIRDQWQINKTDFFQNNFVVHPGGSYSYRVGQSGTSLIVSQSSIYFPSKHKIDPH